MGLGGEQPASGDRKKWVYFGRAWEKWRTEGNSETQPWAVENRVESGDWRAKEWAKKKKKESYNIPRILFLHQKVKFETATAHST